MADEIIFISNALARELVTVRDVLHAVEADFLRQVDPARTVLGIPLAFTTDDRELGFRWRLKTAILRDSPVAGVRVTGYRIDASGRGSGGEAESTRLIVLSDPRTTSPIAIVDEHYTFGLRTSSAVVVAARYLARPDSRRIGLIGVGNVGRAALLGLSEVFPVEQVKVTSTRAASRESFAHSMSAETGLHIEPCDSYEEVCRDTDILICATPAKEPFVRFDWLKPGVFVGAIGDDELEHEVYARCDRFFVDYDPAVERHPNHISAAVAAGATVTGRICDVVGGRLPRRRDAQERVLVSTVGLTSQDIAVAYWLYLRAKGEGRGIRLPM